MVNDYQRGYIRGLAASAVTCLFVVDVRPGQHDRSATVLGFIDAVAALSQQEGTDG